MAGGQIRTAVIGLCGVFVGGLITAGANWLLAVRKEWADAREKREARPKNFRQWHDWSSRILNISRHT